MQPSGTVVLTRADVASVLAIEDCTRAVEQAFRLYGERKTSAPEILGLNVRDGGFHIKAGVLELDRAYFAAKVNANFPHNAKRYGLPCIQGVIVLSDADNGYPLAVMDSIEITIQRTGAATAVAAKYLARPDSRTLTICGCGNQGRISLRALSKLFSFEDVLAYDIDGEQSRTFASDMSTETQLNVRAVHELEKATKRSDIVVTCTPSNEFFLEAKNIQPGTFVAAVGADSEHKQELEPILLAENKTVVDILDQATAIGDLHHAIDGGLMNREQVYAELGEVVTGQKIGRSSDDEIIIFDSTGMALQDVIVAAAVYEKSINANLGQAFHLSGQNTQPNRVSTS
jgi:ornithine cyclodeaminase/alanine dehydrogenase